MLERRQHVRHGTGSTSPKIIKNVYGFHSAKLSCWSDKGVAHGNYSGMLTQSACEYLSMVFFRQSQAQPTVVRLYQSIMVPFSTPPCVDNLIGSPPGCYVVNADQWDRMLAFSELLRAKGVHRLVFPQDHLQLALRWSASAKN